MPRQPLSASTLKELHDEWPHLVGAVREQIAMEWADVNRVSTPEMREKLHDQLMVLDKLEQHLWRVIENGRA